MDSFKKNEQNWSTRVCAIRLCWNVSNRQTSLKRSNLPLSLLKNHAELADSWIRSAASSESFAGLRFARPTQRRTQLDKSTQRWIVDCRIGVRRFKGMKCSPKSKPKSSLDLDQTQRIHVAPELGVPLRPPAKAWKRGLFARWTLRTRLNKIE